LELWCFATDRGCLSRSANAHKSASIAIGASGHFNAQRLRQPLSADDAFAARVTSAISFLSLSLSLP
jgi:hypothetical protein